MEVGGDLTVTGNVVVGDDLTVTGNVAVDTDTLFVDSVNNRVGVGTTTPEVPLNVVGNNALSGNPNNAIASFRATTAVPGTNDAGVVIGSINGNSPYIADVSAASVGLSFYTQNVERMRIASGGNVGIGTTIPTSNLHVVGNAFISSDLTVTGVFYAPGSAVQIQTSVFTDAPSTSDATWKDISSTFGATITPKFSNSKFLIQAMIHQGGDQNDDARWTMYRIGRYISGALTEVGNGNTSTTGGAGTACVAAHNWGASGSSDGNTYDLNIANINILYVDQPNTTSPITYRIRWNSNPGGSGTRTAYINRSDGHTDGYRANTTCTLVVTEIAQ